MSYSFILSNTTSVLSFNFNPPIYLEDDVDYEIGLINFDSFYSIPNIDEYNNTLLWYDGEGLEHKLVIPTGSYEITDLINIIQKQISIEDDDAILRISFDMNTAKIILRTNRKISFDVANSLGPVIGFNNMIVDAENTITGESPVQILKVNAICIDCNIASGSFLNGTPVHIIHQFFPAVSPGYKIIESPLTTIYYPVSLKTINNLTVRIIDQEGNLINFRNEVITVRLHLRKVII